MTTVPLVVDRTQPTPLPAQVAAQIRSLILTGALASGDRLPSSRSLATDLAVSRAVTEQAYEQLSAEGWTAARRGSGTFVASEALPGRPIPDRPTAGPSDARVHLSAGTPWIDPAHRAGWRRAWREVSAAVPPRGYDDPRGLPELRTALAERLGRTRGLDVHPDDIVITAGTIDGLRSVLAELPPGPIAVEDPGYRAATETILSFGRTVIDIPAAQPIRTCQGSVGVYVTPAHQHPLGAVMPAADRIELLTAARAANALIIEDDYDSEFRYDVAPIPAMASLDRNQVVYLGTAAKIVAPSLRVGWIVAPPALLERILRRRAITCAGASWPAQRALLALLRDGWVDKAVRTARSVYSDRAPRVAAAMSPHAQLAGPLAGMYSTWLLPESNALRARNAARAAGFDLNLLSSYARTSTLTGLVIGFGGVTDIELDQALSAITGALQTASAAK